MSVRWAVQYAVQGDVRFLAHRELLRLWERAAARAQLPLKFTQGFNPHPKFSLVLPRPVGVAGRCELLVLELTGNGHNGRRAEEETSPLPAWARRLGQQLPPGLRLLRAEPLTTRAGVRVTSVAYEMPVDPAQRRTVQGRLEELMQREQWQVRRNRPGQRGVVANIRPYLQRMELEEDRLKFDVRIDPDGSARPAEVLALLGLTENTDQQEADSPGPQEAMATLVRTELQWQGPGPDPQGRTETT